MPAVDRERAFEEAASWLIALDRALDDQVAGRDTRAEFQEWLAADPAHREAFESLERLWLDADEVSAQLYRDPLMARAIYSGIDESMEKKSSRGRGLVAAAMVLMFLLLGAGLLRRPPSPLGDRFETLTSEQREIALVDGSRALLSAETVLHVRIDEQRREVELRRGEVLFTVVSDGRPFVVQTSAGTLEALGTEFGVSSRGSEVEVIVLEGRVRATPIDSGSLDSSRKSVELAAAGAMRLDVGLASARSVAEAEMERAVSWRRGVLEFDDVPLSEVVRDLDPYVAGYLVLSSRDLATMRVGGLLRIGPGYDPVESLEKALPVASLRIGDFLTVLRHRSDAVAEQTTRDLESQASVVASPTGE